jgi:tetratricopeptide (TPR) repeat protein
LLSQAVLIDPNYTEALNNRGVVLKELRRFDEALVDFDKAVSLDSKYADALNNRGITYRELGRFDEAIKDLNKAISLKADFEKAYNNRGNIQKDLQHYDLAMEDFNRAIQLDPEYVDAYWNKALCMLHLGDFKSGWPLYEWRWKRDKSISGEPITTTKPMWSGESDKTIFLWSEQGVGDEIMFASLVPELQQTSMHVILHCDKRLVPLFKRSFMGNISFCNDRDTVDENSYDFHIPMGSLPLILRPTLSSFKKGSQAYLKCQQSKADALKSTLLGKQKEILVGISWLSKSKIPGAIQRNVDLAEIAQHLNKPNIKLVNLQYGDVSGEIKSLKDNQNIDVIQVEEIDNKNDIDGLAALIMACDHIVTIDNATVHLASALGAKTKLLLPINHEWRWGLEPKTSYWYDSLELYRQKQLNDWETNLKNISSEIQSKHN